MYLRGALGAAFLAVPLVGAAGQSTSQHDPPATAAHDSSGGHRVVWVAAAGATGAALFTSFVRLSELAAASANADRGSSPTLPGSPVPNHYTIGSLPGGGVSPGQNAPSPGQPQPIGPLQTPPPTGPSQTSQQTQESGSVGTNPGPGPVVFLPPPPGNNQTPGYSTNTPTTQTGDQSPQQPTPPSQPQTDRALVVTTPEPETVFLLGTGFISLIPVLRRRR
jgi:hypothetical protein